MEWLPLLQLAGPSDVIEHKVNGYLVSRRRVFADYARVEMPYVRLWLAERIWKKAKISTQSNYSLDKVNEDWMKIIRELFLSLQIEARTDPINSYYRFGSRRRRDVLYKLLKDMNQTPLVKSYR